MSAALLSPPAFFSSHIKTSRRTNSRYRQSRKQNRNGVLEVPRSQEGAAARSRFPFHCVQRCEQPRRPNRPNSVHPRGAPIAPALYRLYTHIACRLRHWRDHGMLPCAAIGFHAPFFFSFASSHSLPSSCFFFFPLFLTSSSALSSFPDHLFSFFRLWPQNSVLGHLFQRD